MAYEDWSELDDEALEETAAASPDSLTEQQRLLLDQYNISQNTESGSVTDVGIANPQQSAYETDFSTEMNWAELDEEALDEAAAAPEESLTEQQRLCLSRRTESQPPTELENDNRAGDEEPRTAVSNPKTKQNVFRFENDLHILCPWKKLIYDEDNSTEIVQGDDYLKKPSSRFDAYKPSRPSTLRKDVTEILKTREFLNRNPRLTDKYKPSTLGHYSRAHMHGYRRSMYQLRGPSPLREVSIIDMSGIKIIFDRLNRTRKVNAWQHQWNCSQLRMRSPLRQFSSSDPEEPLTADDNSISLLQPKDSTIDVVPPTQAPKDTVATASGTYHVSQTTQPEVVTALGTRDTEVPANGTDSFETTDWSELDDEALEETAASAPDTLTEQQRLLLGQYHMSHSIESGFPLTNIFYQGMTAEPDWDELDEEALDEAATAPEESLTDQQRLCLFRRTESQPQTELEEDNEAEDEETQQQPLALSCHTESQPPTELDDNNRAEDEQPQTPVPNAQTDQNVLWQEDDLQILCPWKKWIYDEDNSIEIVQGDDYRKKPSHRYDAYEPSISSVLRRDVTEILKTREFLNRNPHLTEKHEQSTRADYSRAHLHGYRSSMCHLRGPSPLRQVSTIDMSGTKIIFDRLHRTRKVSAWQHQWNRSQPRMRSPLRQFYCSELYEPSTTDDSCCSDPEESLTTDDSSIDLPEPTDPIIEVIPPPHSQVLETNPPSEERIATKPPRFSRYCLFKIASVLESASKVADAVVNLIR